MKPSRDYIPVEDDSVRIDLARNPTLTTKPPDCNVIVDE